MRKEIRQGQAPINVGHKTQRYEVATRYPQHEEMKA